MRSKVNNVELEHGVRPIKLANCKIEIIEKWKSGKMKWQLIQTTLKKIT